MEKLEIPWRRDMSLHVKDTNGLQTLMNNLRSKSEWTKVQAASIIAYITESHELIAEVESNFLPF